LESQRMRWWGVDRERVWGPVWACEL
jgi:hypothetical protein